MHLSWEGRREAPYENMTRLLFNVIDQGEPTFHGNPENNWNFDLDDIFNDNQNLPEYFSVINGFCIQIEMNPRRIPETEMFSMSMNTNQELQVLITEAGRSPYYQLNQDLLYGDKIETRNGAEKYYDIAFEEVYMKEEDGECTNYGEAAPFKTYADCVARKDEEVFLPMFGCLVPWMGAPKSQGHCTGKVTTSIKSRQEFTKIVQNILYYSKFNIYQETKACKKPCREIKVISKLKSSDKTSSYWTSSQGIELNFQKTVKVTRYLKAYGLFELVVDVGSSLGLWIGLSILGVFDLILQASSKIHQIWDGMSKKTPRQGRGHTHSVCPPGGEGKYLYKNTYFLHFR